jgi:predicted metal-dependent peptidase
VAVTLETGNKMQHQIKVNPRDNNPDLKVSHCLYKLMKDHGFYGSMAVQVGVSRDDTIPTMSATPHSIKWSGLFVQGLTEAEIIAVIVHEVIHIVLKHHIRMGSREHKMWNVACDYVDNQIVRRMNLSLPDGALFDDRFEGMTAEKVYAILKEEGKEVPDLPEWGIVNPSKGDDGQGEGQGVNDKSGGDMSNEMIEVQIDQMIKTAAITARGRGDLPAFIEKLVNEMEQNQIDWENVVLRFVAGDQPQELSMRRIDRQAYYLHDMMTPTICGQGVGDLVVYIDTSGSVDIPLYKKFLGSINAISEDIKPKSITVIYCDTEVNTVETYEGGDPIRSINVVGRGGTRIKPVFDYIKENNLDVDHFIGFTDCEIWDWPDSLDFPALFVAPVGSDKAKVGETTFIS